MIDMGLLVSMVMALAPQADPETIEAAVQDWLDDHPEATTTVADGSITEAKLAQQLATKIGQISTLSDEIVDLKSAIDSNFNVFAVSNYEQGSIGATGAESENAKRIRSAEIQQYNYPIYLKAKAGYRFACVFYSNGTFTVDNYWLTDFIVPTGQQFRLVIGQNPEGAAQTVEDLYDKVYYYEYVSGLMQYINIAYSDLPRNTDLNTITTNGKWLMRNVRNYGYQNAPIGVTAGILSVDNPLGEVSAYSQTIISTVENVMCYRTYNGSAWSDWQTVKMTGIQRSYNDIPVNTDFNTITESGIYMMRNISNYGYTNVPDGVRAGVLVVENPKSETNACTQILFPTMKNAVCYRTYTGAVWTEWAQFSNADVKNNSIITVGHRGAALYYPENTLPSYRGAKLMNFDYADCDIQFTSDHIPVCLHDTTIDRTSNGTGYIYQMTYAEASQYDYGSWFNTKFAGTTIPTFEQAVATFRALGIGATVDIKPNSAYTESDYLSLVAIAKKYNMVDNLIFCCSSDTVLGYILTAVPTARVGYLVASITDADAQTAVSLKTDSNQVMILTSSGTISDSIVETLYSNKIDVATYNIDTGEGILAVNPYVKYFISYIDAKQVFYKNQFS